MPCTGPRSFRRWAASDWRTNRVVVRLRWMWPVTPTPSTASTSFRKTGSSATPRRTSAGKSARNSTLVGQSLLRLSSGEFSDRRLIWPWVDRIDIHSTSVDTLAAYDSGRSVVAESDSGLIVRLGPGAVPQGVDVHAQQ